MIKVLLGGGFEPQTLQVFSVVHSTTELPFAREGFEPSHHNPLLNTRLSRLEYLRNTVQHAVGTAGQEVTSDTRAMSNIPQYTDAISAFFVQQTAGYLTPAPLRSAPGKRHWRLAPRRDKPSHPFTTPTVFSFLTGVTISSCCAMTWSISL